MLRCLSLLLLAASLPAQSFEVASLKRVGERSRTLSMLSGGPGSASPDRVTMIAPLGMLLSAAFELPTSRLILEAKSPALSEFYELNAIVPEGAKKEDLPAMYRNLLIERFHMKFHTETREVKLYELIVAPDGHKLTPSAGEPPPVPRGTTIGTPGADGYPTLPAGFSGVVGFGGKWVLQRPASSVDQLAKDVEGQMRDGVVINQTGITGKFDIKMRWATAGPATAPGASTDLADPPFQPSLRAQLGLIVRDSKGPGEVTVIDGFDAAATEN